MIRVASACRSAEARATWAAGGSTPASTAPSRRNAASSWATTLRAVIPRAAMCTCVRTYQRIQTQSDDHFGKIIL